MYSTHKKPRLVKERDNLIVYVTQLVKYTNYITGYKFTSMNKISSYLAK